MSLFSPKAVKGKCFILEIISAKKGKKSTIDDRSLKQNIKSKTNQNNYSKILHLKSR